MGFEPLSQNERNHLLSLVTEEQRHFLQKKLKRGRETIFGNFMLSEKVSAIKSADEIELLEDEQDVVDWKIIKYHDYGLRNRQGKCSCGRALRYEFIVQHSTTKKSITYGKVHLADFLNLQVRDIDDVVNGLRIIDNELDELLNKIKREDYGYEILDALSDKIKLPKGIQEHVEFHIPLLNGQIRRLAKIIQDKEEEENLNRRKALLKEQLKERKEQFATYQKANQLIKARFELEAKEQQAKEQKIIEAVNEGLPLKATLGEIAYSFIKTGLTSATEISHIIRNNYNVDKRISSGLMRRPYIYMDVVLAFMEYAKQGYLIIDKESSGIGDCIFLMNPEEQADSTIHNAIQTTFF